MTKQQKCVGRKRAKSTAERKQGVIIPCMSKTYFYDFKTVHHYLIYGEF